MAAVTLAAYGVRGDLGVLVRSLVVLPLSFDATFSSPFIKIWLQVLNLITAFLLIRSSS